MDVQLVSVFTDKDPFHSGNPLAVLRPLEEIPKARMQALARTLNLSETTFVTDARDDSYEVRIFTPEEELPFAGHPTLGTAWVLRRAGLLREDEVEQRSRSGITRVSFRDDEVWFEREGTVEADLEERDTQVLKRVANALGLAVDQIGAEARELGRSGHLRPAFADAGLRQLIVPVRDVAALQEARPEEGGLREIGRRGAYVFTASGAGTMRARGFWGPIGVPEDPATGSAAAGLGLYLGQRLGDIRFEITQGVEIGRPSRISVLGSARRAQVGGRCASILKGEVDDAIGG